MPRPSHNACSPWAVRDQLAGQLRGCEPRERLATDRHAHALALVDRDITTRREHRRERLRIGDQIDAERIDQRVIDRQIEKRRPPRLHARTRCVGHDCSLMRFVDRIEQPAELTAGRSLDDQRDLS